MSCLSDRIRNRAGLTDYHIATMVATKYNIDKTPGYDINNANRSIVLLLTRDMVVSRPNNIVNRIKRTLNEKMYIIHSDTLDKISTILSVVLFGLAAGMYILSIGAIRTYTHPDPDQQSKMDILNGVWFQLLSSYVIPLISGVVSAIGMWKWVKRTTIPKKSIEAMRVMPMV